jgi:PPOX class probable F420-dependent enzyme
VEPPTTWAEEARIAHLATLAPDGHPHLVPITFALRGNVLVTAVDHKPKSTTNLRRIANIETDDRVCVLIDHYSEDWTLLRWLRLDGHARILRGPDQTEPLSWLIAKYHQYRHNPPTGPVIRIDITHRREWTAR